MNAFDTDIDTTDITDQITELVETEELVEELPSQWTADMSDTVVEPEQDIPSDPNETVEAVFTMARKDAELLKKWLSRKGNNNTLWHGQGLPFDTFEVR
jgi:hypothetical protein